MSETDISLYDYELPPELVAQTPAARRDGSRLMILDRARDDVSDGRFPDLVERLREGDLLVVNDARVFPARFPLFRSGGGDAELLLLEPAGSLSKNPAWECVVRPASWARRLMDRGEAIELVPAGALARVNGELGDGRFLVVFEARGEPLDADRVLALAERHGHVPLPPYIARARDDERAPADRERYQTVYAEKPVAVAAPTAGLHFTDDLLESIRARGVEIVAITHQVGIGTFQPIRVEDIARHELHRETSEIGAEAGARLLAARRDGRRIVAVGTTTVRALESFARSECSLPYRVSTDLYIRPGHRFELVDALVTNFHLPRSSLLVLVSAFAGRERILRAYRRAIEAGFRFYSYGDAMMIV